MIINPLVLELFLRTNRCKTYFELDLKWVIENRNSRILKIIHLFQNLKMALYNGYMKLKIIIKSYSVVFF